MDPSHDTDLNHTRAEVARAEGAQAEMHKRAHALISLGHRAMLEALRRTFLFTALLCVIVPGHGQIAAQDRAPSLEAQLRSIVAASGLTDQSGISVVNAATGQALFAHRSRELMNPASTMKLITAAAALTELGADFRFETSVHGTIDSNGHVNRLFIRGRGDPSLRRRDLRELARALLDSGVTRVGTVLIDASHFDNQFLPPAFEQQPNEVAPFRASVAALSIDRNAYGLRVVSGSAGAPIVVRAWPSRHFVINDALRIDARARPVVVVLEQPDAGRISLRVGGHVQPNTRATYRRRVSDPLGFAGHAFIEALAEVAIEVTDPVPLRQTVPAESPTLAIHTSEPLAQILPAMGKWSDNFTAEMILKVLGAHRHEPGSSAGGVEALRDVLQRAGVTRAAPQIVNGSGLFNGNRIAPEHFTGLLSWTFRNTEVAPEYLAHLSIAGVDGTLQRRLTDLPRPRMVRGKTGTLDDVIALSGYVLGREPGNAIAFSITLNGVHGRHAAARRLCDDVVRAIARSN